MAASRSSWRSEKGKNYTISANRRESAKWTPRLAPECAGGRNPISRRRLVAERTDLFHLLGGFGRGSDRRQRHHIRHRLFAEHVFTVHLHHLVVLGLFLQL